VPLLIRSDWIKQVKFKECYLALLGIYSDVHGRVPKGTLGSERVKWIGWTVYAIEVVLTSANMNVKV
jgi:hypothetical protein